MMWIRGFNMSLHYMQEAEQLQNALEFFQPDFSGTGGIRALTVPCRCPRPPENRAGRFRGQNPSIIPPPLSRMD